MKEKILLSWSGGKDSALSLYELKNAGQFEIAALITTVTDAYDRISMHGVRRTLLEQQADALGIHLEQVMISPKAGNEEYEAKMRAVLEKYHGLGISGPDRGCRANLVQSKSSWMRWGKNCMESCTLPASVRADNERKAAQRKSGIPQRLKIHESDGFEHRFALNE